MSASLDALRHIIEEEGDGCLARDFVADISPNQLEKIGREAAKNPARSKKDGKLQSEQGKEARLQELIAQMPCLNDIPLEPGDFAYKITPWEESTSE